MLSVTFPYDLGQEVYYIHYLGLYSNARIVKGVIQGFQVRKTKEGYRIGVDFRQNNNVPIETVSANREVLELLVNRYNTTPPEERIG